ncbi:SAM-dependent methyltransferase [Nitrincola tapanii]|uniref:Class I SAM-dependent methyltransferase n=1 Tax=Nitrincola tapanii TaxID=1708751 RepID=A0A5A9W6Q4_9GAMM|nr:cyclopropane-fatty-acyl-phospholipid synthase family protein [Nitrincola tapanii]KAA0875699.1 class I SAM-dependent methyltransferase [Nitrincola tapanii]
MKPTDTNALSARDLLPEHGWLSRFCFDLILRHLPDLAYGTLDLELPNGQTLQFGQAHEGEPRAELRLHSMKAIRRLISDGLLGWAEGYMAGEWDSPDLVSLIQWALGNEAQLSLISQNSTFWTRLFNKLQHLKRANTRRGSRRNIAYHYDLGNDFYQLWLDPSMTYSSALFTHPEQSLFEAQQAKYRRIAQMLDLKPGQQVLEVGCGWGGFAELAAREFGVRVFGITLSKEQLAYAQARIQQAGLTDLCQFSLTDYRDLKQSYDHIVSIEMFEAVGEENWPTYFNTLKRVLKPGGKAVLQIISIENKRFESYRRDPDFIQRYIFPGGMLPSPERLTHEVRQAGFHLSATHTFGKDYAHTLKLWRHSFLEQWPRIQAQGFDERFKRMWLYYLAYCEGGFDAGSIDVGFYQLESL